MNERGLHTKIEILSQPNTWASSLKTLTHYATDLEMLYSEGKYDQVILTGCGSPYYAALSAVPLFGHIAHCPAKALPASEIFHYPELYFSPNTRTLLIVSSRSGETTELLWACDSFKAGQRGDILTLSCVPGAPLTKEGAINVVFQEAGEQSLAQTRALSTLYIAAAALVFLWSGRKDLYEALFKLPVAGKSVLDRYAELAEKLGSDSRFSRFYFLGSGPRYGLASELALKMKETSLTHSEPFHVLEFRHGPKTMVNEETLLFTLVASGEDRLEMAVADEMRQAGAEVVVSGESGCTVDFKSGLPEAVQHVLHLPFGQMMAYYHSISRGLNPDVPENLNAVVKL